jgi:hypothetical protein
MLPIVMMKRLSLNQILCEKFLNTRYMDIFWFIVWVFVVALLVYLVYSIYTCARYGPKTSKSSVDKKT